MKGNKVLLVSLYIVALLNFIMAFTGSSSTMNIAIGLACLAVALTERDS